LVKVLYRRPDPLSADLATWKWRVQEEADFDVLLTVADLLAKHQVVIVNSDNVFAVYFARDLLSKEAILGRFFGQRGLSLRKE
jgi:hypothetical protein